MTAMVLVDTIGVLSGALGIIGFFQDQIPDASHLPQGAIVTVKVGLEPGDDDAELGGNLAAVYGWSSDNNYLGQADGKDIVHGDSPSFTLDQGSPGTRAEYVGLTGGDDAICIAWIAVGQFDGTTGGAWTGDIGYSCGQDWYENSEFAGYLNKSAPQAPENEYTPRCSWLDGDHTNDIMAASMKFRTLAYGAEVVDTVNNAKQCDATIWGADTGPIPDPTPGKRFVGRQRKQWMENRLVVSNVTRHRAAEMCNSATSWGPDFVSEADGYFCDMGTKILTPLCSTENIDGCLNIDSVEKRVTKRTTTAKRAVELAHKSYKKVELWGH